MITKMAISGIFYNLFLIKNKIRIHPAVNPKVRTLKVENVKLIISNGFVNGVQSDAKKNAFIFSIAKGKN